MKELLEKLLGSELLTDEVRTELTEGFTAAVAAAAEAQINEAKAALELEKETLVVEYAKQFAADREALIEAIDTKVEEMLQANIAELADDIANFRDLEVEFAAKLVEEKATLAEAVERDMTSLLERLDTFIEIRLSEEIDELKESIEDVRKNNLGRKIFETFKSEFEEFSNVDSGISELQAKLDEANEMIAERDVKLAEAKKELEITVRKDTIENVLSSLHGRPREIMEAILGSIATDKLQETYDKFINRVLHESVTPSNSEKETAVSAVEAPVLAESETVEKESNLNEGTITLTGNSEIQSEVEAAASAPVELSENAKHLMRLAGITAK